jgi:integrase
LISACSSGSLPRKADAVTALLAAPDPGTRLGLRDQFFMILMYDLAARDAEMLALTLADIDARRLTNPTSSRHPCSHSPDAMFRRAKRTSLA